MAGWLAVGLLVTGCGQAATPGHDTAVVVTAGATPPAAATRATTPPASPGAATPGGPCPTQAQWMGLPAPTHIDGTPANTPEAEALSQAVGTAGREAAFRDVYGTQISDYPAGRVALCVTDQAGGHRLAAEAKRIDPRIDLGRLDLYVARYAQARLDAAARPLVSLMPKGALGFPVNSVSPASDASSLQVGTSTEGVKSAAFKRYLETLAGGVPVTLIEQKPMVAQ